MMAAQRDKCFRKLGKGRENGGIIAQLTEGLRKLEE
jgi:hypothetical protein